MIHVHTMVQVVDNSGAVLVRCIRLLRGCKINSATVGNYIVGSVQKVASFKLTKKNKAKKTIAPGDICKALIICSSTRKKRFGTMSYKTDKNSIILVADNFLPTSNRIVGPAFLELRKAKQLKVLSLADYVL